MKEEKHKLIIMMDRVGCIAFRLKHRHTHTHKGGITWSYFAVLSASAIGQPRGLDVFLELQP